MLKRHRSPMWYLVANRAKDRRASRRHGGAVMAVPDHNADERPTFSTANAIALTPSPSVVSQRRFRNATTPSGRHHTQPGLPQSHPNVIPPIVSRISMFRMGSHQGHDTRKKLRDYLLWAHQIRAKHPDGIRLEFAFGVRPKLMAYSKRE